MSQELMRSYVGVQDAFIWHSDHPIFEPKPWHTVNMFVMDHKPFSAKSVPTQAGETGVFTLNKACNVIIKARLEFDVVTQGTAGTYMRHCDWFGKRCLETVEVKYNSNRLARFTGKQLYDQMLLEKSEKEILEMAELEGGLMTEARRESRSVVDASTGTHYAVDLPFWATSDISYSLHTHILATEVEIDVTFASTAKTLETDHTTGVNYELTNVKIVPIYAHLTPEDRAHILQESRKDDGLVYLSLDHETQEKAVDSGDTSIEIELTNIRGSITEIRLTRIRTSKTNASSTLDPGAYEVISTIKIDASGTEVYRVETGTNMSYYERPLFHPKGITDARVYSIPFAFEPGAKQDRSGAMNFGNLNNPVLTLTFPAIAAATTIYIDAISNNLIHARAGDMTRVFF